MNRRKYRILILVSLTILCGFLNYSLRNPYGPSIEQVLEKPLQPFEKSKFILHALSPENFESYTNSWEGFEEGYRQGFRVFEVDLEFTKDDRLVCFHQGMEKGLELTQPISETLFSEFSRGKYYSKWSTLSAEALLSNISKFPDTFLVLDTKGDFKRMIKRVAEISRASDQKIMNRIVPQIYGDGIEDLRDALGTYPFPYIIYTLYRTKGSEERVFDYLKLNRVSAVTYSLGSKSDEFPEKMSALNMPVFVHPVNSDETAKELFDNSVYGIYSSKLSPMSFSTSQQGGLPQ